MKFPSLLFILFLYQEPATAVLKEDNLWTLVIQILDKGVLGKLYPTNMNQEVTLYVTKYKQLIAQLLTLIRQIDFHTFKKLKVYLKKEHLLNLISKYDPDLSNVKDKLGFTLNKIKFKRVQKYLSDTGMPNDLLHKQRVMHKTHHTTTNSMYSRMVKQNEVSQPWVIFY